MTFLYLNFRMLRNQYKKGLTNLTCEMGWVKTNYITKISKVFIV